MAPIRAKERAHKKGEIITRIIPTKEIKIIPVGKVGGRPKVPREVEDGATMLPLPLPAPRNHSAGTANPRDWSPGTTGSNASGKGSKINDSCSSSPKMIRGVRALREQALAMLASPTNKS